jgi:predicted RNA-binding protein with PUA-like domain
MRYWLMKSEPDEVSFDDVLAAPGRIVAWFGVRNYQAEHMCVFGEKMDTASLLGDMDR